MDKNQKKRILAKLLMSYISANILCESLDEDLIDRNLFKRQSKFYAKCLLESLEKDIVPLYSSLESGEGISGYSSMFDLINEFIKNLTSEIVENIEP